MPYEKCGNCIKKGKKNRLVERTGSQRVMKARKRIKLETVAGEDHI